MYIYICIVYIYGDVLYDIHLRAVMEKLPATPTSTTVPSTATSSSPTPSPSSAPSPTAPPPVLETPPLRKQAHLDAQSLPATESLQSLPSLPSMRELFDEDTQEIRKDLEKQLSEEMLSQDSGPQFTGVTPMGRTVSVLAHASSFADTSKEAEVCKAGSLQSYSWVFNRICHVEIKSYVK